MSSHGDSSAARIFSTALELDADSRRAYVDSECAADAALRRDVDSLLEAAAGASEYFDGFADRLGVPALVDPGATGAHGGGGSTQWGSAARGQQIGPYTLDERIGAGGMGTVWRASRSDGRFEGDVAIKLLNLAAGSPAARRFELEGRYLARLNHPNIARLLDAGVGREGAPYLVLEHVEGSTIDDYCDTRRLTVAERIRLFLDVLAAVTHAHAHLIVHRDLKPSNILVGTNAAVKLLDFGVAKLLAGEGPRRGAHLTREVGAALTPAYASPEQLRGEEITTATDIYSLGLVLAELLTGRSLREPGDVATLEELRALATEKHPPLSELVAESSRTSEGELAANAERRGGNPATLSRVLRGDLDNIVHKALALDPERRFATVADFAEDLGRYLRHEPVKAQPPTLGYRVRKFVQRHRGGVVVALVTTVALLAAVGVAAWQAVEAARQRDAALYQQQRAQASVEFFSLLLEELGSAGEPLTSVELLDQGARMLEQQYGVRERFVGKLSYDISLRYGNLGQKKRELELLERAEEIARARKDDDLLAVTLCTTAQSFLLQKPDVARSQATEANALLAQLRTPSIETLVSCQRLKARLLESDGNREAAIKMLQGLQRELDESPVASAHQRGVTLNDLALLYFRSERYGDTLAALDQILEALEAAGRGQTLGYLKVLANRGVVLTSVGEILAQEETWQEIAQRSRQLEKLGRKPPAFSTRMAATLVRLSRFDEALELFSASRAQAADEGDVRTVALADLEIGRLLHQLGRHAEAARRLDEAESVLSRDAAAHGRHLASIRMIRAVRLREEGRTVEAREIVNALLAKLGYPEKRNAPNLLSPLRVAAGIELAAEDYAAAERFATDQLDRAVARARAPERSADVGEALVQRAEARLGLGKAGPAIDDLKRAVESLENGLGTDNPQTAEARELLQRAKAKAG